MASSFNNISVVHNNNFIGLLYGGKTMGNNKRGTAFQQGVECLLHGMFRFSIESGRSFIKNEQGGIFEHCTGNTEALPLPSRQCKTAVSNGRIIALWQLIDKFVGMRNLGRLTNSLDTDIRSSKSDICRHSIIK